MQVNLCRLREARDELKEALEKIERVLEDLEPPRPPVPRGGVKVIHRRSKRRVVA